ncbi:hormogonium polysaccharide biosynthesis glycosyltransferase HpsN [Leptolyngbya sp. FACHB-261]|uniref:hormogonium polysaccharide biosynthesis glycosyltransferase HpsN n=1 Tax=Leptolyngbya sp. FACHB-261 TaxID=2692806 RepID=UPI001685B0CF|nr:hormogonium polysaccharide biosynthesis glycosyltransferase HpsN [Leptolyngbya sp. FACHB-261]MBD2099532.1 glycosyltransferase [Leptolyngbya sp. FACHB-261]
MNWPSVSVIVPTYCREEPLRATLADVLRQDYPNFEVLVVDQTPVHQPETRVYLDELAQAGKIQLFQVDWASLPGARNYAVRRAKGEIVLFIDDDVQLPDGYLQAHARNFANPDVGAVAGRVLDRMKLADDPVEATEQGPDLMPPEAMDPGIGWYYIDLYRTRQPQQVLTARGCNMSFRKVLFTEHGLHFDERFRGSAVREESDFCLNIRKTGFKIWYDPEAVLVHLGEETGGCHDIGFRSVKYQVTFYHNHFLMALKNLSPSQLLALSVKLFDCHVLGHPPCYKSGSLDKIVVRGGFYLLGLVNALGTLLRTGHEGGQTYTEHDQLPSGSLPVAATSALGEQGVQA